LWSVFEIQGRNGKSTGWFGELGKRGGHGKGGCHLIRWVVRARRPRDLEREVAVGGDWD
jgi:hypothetical protein